ncbi:MAG: exodeoxyribonuclease VII small subunit [Candidatus Zixiibacteriota bacterium]
MATTNQGPNVTSAPQKFEDAFARLQEIVETLESGDVPLEEALTLYTEGIALVRVCGEKLTAAQQRIEQLNAESAVTPAEGE